MPPRDLITEKAHGKSARKNTRKKLSTMPLRDLITEKVATLQGILCVQTATEKDALWIEHLQRRFSNQLGFVPRSAIPGLIEARNYLKLALDGNDAGYVLACGGTTKPVRISQIAVDEALWRLGLGSATIEVIRKKALAFRKPSVVVTVRDGLAMNQVALDTGAVHTHTTITTAKRKKRLLSYRWDPHGKRDAHST